MQKHVQEVQSSPPRVFRYSLDWRFLLPMADVSKIWVVVENDADFSQTLERVGIPVSNQISFSDVKQDRKDDTESLVLPFGLPVRWVSAQPKDQIEFYRSIRHLICPSGHILIGFESRWQAGSNITFHPSTPRRIAHQLTQAGFRSIQIFGAMPDLRIPEYIFELQDQAIDFAMRHRFRRKTALLRVIQTVSHTVGLSRLSGFLPCYFAIAVA
jgi:hypothetical protein